MWYLIPVGMIIMFVTTIILFCYCIIRKGKIATMRPGRYNRNNSTNYQSVTVTQVTPNKGLERVRIPLRSSQEYPVDEDGFILLPEPGDITQTTAAEATDAATASPVVVPPYPVDARHPTPQTNSGIGFGGSNPPYPTHTPHPIPTAVPLYYPPPMGITPYPPTSAPTPYPPTSPPVSGSAPYPDYSGSPPSYSEAVAHAPVQPPKLEQEAFGKQAPYNPNY